MTYGAVILPPVDLLVFLPSNGALAGLRSDEFAVTYRREFRIPTDLSIEAHPKLGSHFARRGNLMLIMSEDHELPCELRELRSILMLEMINLLNVPDDLIEIPPDTINTISFGAGTIDRARDVSHSIFY